MRALTITTCLVCFFTGTAAAFAECPSSQEISRYVEQWKARQPAKALPVDDMKDAACSRDKIVEAIGGKVVG